MEKYSYIGPTSLVCPVCDKRRTGISIPVIYIRDGNKYHEQLWCGPCFNKVHQLIASLNTGRLIEQNLPTLTDMAQRALRERMPDDSQVTGYWTSTISQQGLTLVMELRNDT